MRDDAVTRALIRARRRITDPRHWTTGAFARDAAGRKAFPRSAAAVAWCALGAVEVEVSRGSTNSAWARDRLARAAGGLAPSFVNDERGHAAVLEMFDQAIRRK